MKKLILIIDDDKTILKLYSRMLESETREIHTASSGAEALERVAQLAYDLILLDLKMPDMDGTQILRKIHGINQKTRIFIVTAFQSKYAVQLKAIEQDGIPFEILNKPIGRDLLRAAVNGAIEGPVVITDEKVIRIRLYTSGKKRNLEQDFDEFRRYAENNTPYKYTFEIINLLDNPGVSEVDDVFVTPTIVKVSPPNTVKVIGDISDAEKIALHLGLFST